jgi:hypothetical protein
MTRKDKEEMTVKADMVRRPHVRDWSNAHKQPRARMPPLSGASPDRMKQDETG